MAPAVFSKISSHTKQNCVEYKTHKNMGKTTKKTGRTCCRPCRKPSNGATAMDSMGRTWQAYATSLVSKGGETVYNWKLAKNTKNKGKKKTANKKATKTKKHSESKKATKTKKHSKSKKATKTKKHGKSK